MQSADPDYYIKNEDPTTDYYIEDYEAGEYVSYEEEPVYSESETEQGPDGSTYITNNYYGPGGFGDFYDYGYSARINRFYNPYMGFGYYSPCYVGFFYDPWLDPFWYGPSFQFGMSWGWGGFGWGNPGWGWGAPGWGYPGWGWGYPYNSYWYGYNHGFWDGYYASGEGGSGSYYYGPRTNSSGSNAPFSRANSEYTIQSPKSTYLERNRPLLSSGVVAVPASRESSVAGSRAASVAVENNSRNVQGTTQASRASAGLVAGQSAERAVNQQKGQDVPKAQSSAEKPRYIYQKPATRNGNASERYDPGNTISSRSETQPTRRYTKPESVNASRNVNRSAETPSRQRSVYSRPESNSNPLYTRPSQRTSTSRYTQPSSTQSKRYTQPSRTNTRSYSQPSRSSVEYKRPSNTYNSSRRSYSRPSSTGGSRSSSGIRSTSSPSRSSGGGGRSSSSSRSSGGRR